MIKPVVLRYVRFLSVLLVIFVVLFSVTAPGLSAQAAPPSTNIELNKSFNPISIPAGAASHLSISIFNSNAFQLTDATWSDNLEGTLLAGQHLKLANPVNLSNDCGGSVTLNDGSPLVPGATTLKLTGGTVPPISGLTPGQCTVTVDVTSITPGNLINTIPAGNLTATGATGTISNTTPASATLHVDMILTPVLSKVFGKHTVLTGEVTTLTLTIKNSDPDHALTGVSLIDNLPIGTNDPTPLPGNVLIAAPLPTTPMLDSAGCGNSAIATLTQADGTALAVGAHSVKLNGGTIAPGGTCTIVVNVEGDTAGTYTNTIPAGIIGSTNGIQTDQGVTNPSSVHDDLNVQENITKSFSPAKFYKGTSTTLTITLDNPTATDYTGVNLVDVLPTDGITPTPNQYLYFTGTQNTTCAGSPALAVSTTNNANDTLTLTGGTVPASSTCIITATVGEQVADPATATYPMIYTNTIPPGGVSGGFTNSKPVTGTVTTVNTVSLPTLSKSFGKSPIWAGEVTTLTLGIKNNDANVTLTGVSLIDNLPTNVMLANAITSLTNCGAGATLTEADGTTALSAGSTSVMLNGGSIAAGATCTIVVHVTSDTQGSYPNTTGAFSMDQPGTPASKSATLNVREVNITKGFSPSSFQAGGISHLTITLYNPSDTDYNITSLTDTLPAGLLRYTGTPTTTCPGSLQPSLNSPTNTILTLTGGTIPAATGSPSYPNGAGTCTISVDVTTTGSPASTTTYTNTIHPGDFCYDGVSPTCKTIAGNITGNVTVYPLGDGVVVTKSFSPTTISVPIVGSPGTQSSRLQIRITAPLDTDLTEFHITDNLPASPAQVTVSNSTPASTAGCDTPAPASGAVVLTANVGDTAIALTHGRIAAGTTCTINVWVTSASNTRGAYNNVIQPGDLGDKEDRTTTANATSTLTYQDAPAPLDMSISKWFDSDTVNNNGISTLHIRLQNVDSVALVDVSLQDDLTTMAPNTVVIASPLNVTNSCGGTVTATALGTLISLAAGTISGQVNSVPGICEITVDVQASGSSSSTTDTIHKANVSGTYSGTSVTISPPSDATAALKIGGLSIAAVKGFDPLLVYGNGVSTLSVQLINNNNSKLSGIKFVDNMPPGMIIANPAMPNVGTCGGALTVVAGASSYSFSGGSLNPKSSCTLTLKATILVNGNLTNRIEAGVTFPLLGVTTREGAQSPDPTEASLTNLPGADLSKLFAPNPIAVGGASLLTITITNTNGISLSELGLIDNLPAGLTIAASPAPVNNCGGTLTAATGTTLIQLNNDGSLAANTDCTIVVAVTSDTPGTYMNCMDVGTLTDHEGASNKQQTCDTLKVVGDLGNAKTLTDTSESFTSGSDVAIGEIATYEVSTGLAAGVGLSNVVLTDRMQKGLAYVDCLSVVVAGVDRTAEFCSATPSNPPVVSPITDPGDLSTNPANNGRQVVFNLGDVTNLTGSDSTMVVRYRAVVLDVAENKNGSTLYNNATWTWGGSSIPIEGPHLKVVEPHMSVEKIVSPTVAALGAPLTFTLNVAHTADSAADSFDVAITDALPAGLAFIPGSTAYTGLVPSTSTYDPGTATLKFTWDLFPLGQTASITFQANFVGPAPVVNSTDVVWSSLSLDPRPDGTPVQLSTYNDHSTERWFYPANSAGVDNYQAQASVSIDTPSSGGGRGRGGGGATASVMPLTGFAPGVITALPAKPANVNYTSSGVTLEIPALGIRTSIVGVPQSGNTWDVTWLGGDVGYLNGTAFPTWVGNSVLTGHVYLSNGLPGPFVNLHTLQWGDQIIVHLAGQKYIYQVREDKVLAPDDTSVFKHEDSPWLTLITCKDYNAAANTYAHRVVVTAVLVKVEPE